MPQVFQVLRCYKCLVFQVHQSKKSNKWQCKLCGEKQSVKRHYGIGTGKECRLHVQKLNKMRGDKEELIESLEESDDEGLAREDNILKSNPSMAMTENSKWNEYIDQSIDLESHNETVSDCEISSIGNSYKRKIKRKYNKVKIEDSNENEQLVHTINDSIDNYEQNLFRDSISEYIPCPVTKPQSSTNIWNRTGNNINPSHSNNKLSIKNSKWSNYIDENESNSSNESIYPDKDNTICETSSTKINKWKITPLLNRKRKSNQRNFNIDNNKDNNISTTHLPKYLNHPENKTENQSTIFTLCEDNDLDSILNI